MVANSRTDGGMGFSKKSNGVSIPTELNTNSNSKKQKMMSDIAVSYYTSSKYPIVNN